MRDLDEEVLGSYGNGGWQWRKDRSRGFGPWPGGCAWRCRRSARLGCGRRFGGRGGGGNSDGSAPEKARPPPPPLDNRPFFIFIFIFDEYMMLMNPIMNKPQEYFDVYIDRYLVVAYASRVFILRLCNVTLAV